MIVPNLHKALPINPVDLAMKSGMTRRRSFVIPPVPRPQLLTNQLRGCCASCDSGLAGLGFNLTDIEASQNDLLTSGNSSVLGAIAAGANFIPGVGPIASSALQIFSTAITQFENWFHIGAGRNEADVIVPVQNDLMARLGQLTSAILTGQSPSILDLQNDYRELWQLGTAFMEFVLQSTFTDRRASGQALNTVMPYIDGSCGYPVPLGLQIPASVQSNCITWGDGTIGGPGTNGIMGAVARAIQAKGGSVPAMPATMISAANSGFKVSQAPPVTQPPGGVLTTTQGFSDLIPVLLGIGSLMLLAGKRVF